MTVSTTNNRKDYTGNGSTDTYSFDFPIFADTDLNIYQAGVLLALTTDYTVTLDTDAPSTGHITLVAGNLGGGIALAIVRNVPSTQSVDLVDNDAFPAETVEAELDRLTMLVQQLEEKFDRALLLLASSTQNGKTLDDLVAGSLLRVKADASGVEMVNVSSSGVDEAIGRVSLVEGSAPSGVAGQDVLYADSSAHKLLVKNNNGSARTIAYLEENQTWPSIQTLMGISTLSMRGSLSLDATLSPAQLTGAANDYDPFGSNQANILRLSSDASRNITGIVNPPNAVGGLIGAILGIVNIGAQDIVLKNEDAGSSAINRFAIGADVTLNPDESCLLWYDYTSDRWRILGRNN